MLGEIDDLEVKPSPNRGMTPRIFEFLFARIRAVTFDPLLFTCFCISCFLIETVNTRLLYFRKKKVEEMSS